MPEETPTKQRLRAKRELTEMIGTAFATYARFWLPLLGISLLNAPLFLAAGALDQRINSESGEAWIGLLQIPAIVVNLVVAASLIKLVDEAATGTEPKFDSGLDFGLANVMPVLTTIFLVLGLVMLSLASWPFMAVYWLFNRRATIDGRRNWWLVALPFVLTMYLAIRWSLSQQMVVIERRANWAALDASADLLRERWWRTFGFLMAVYLPFVLAIQGLTELGTRMDPFPAALMLASVQVLLLPLVLIYATLVYYDLNVRREPDVTDSPAGITDPEPNVPREGA